MAKRIPMMQMTRRYGHTVYNISAYSNPDSDSTYEEKLLQLIHHEINNLSASTQYDEKTNDRVISSVCLI